MKRAKVQLALQELEKLANRYDKESSHYAALGREHDARHRVAQASGIRIAVQNLERALGFTEDSPEPEYGTTTYVMKKALELARKELGIDMSVAGKAATGKK